MFKLKIFFLIIFQLFISVSPSFGYIGPGMAGGVLAAAMGVVLVIVLGIFAILFYPIKIFLSKFKKKEKLDDHKEEKDNN